jgi:hypothetical protein
MKIGASTKIRVFARTCSSVEKAIFLAQDLPDLPESQRQSTPALFHHARRPVPCLGLSRVREVIGMLPARWSS